MGLLMNFEIPVTLVTFIFKLCRLIYFTIALILLSMRTSIIIQTIRIFESNSFLNVKFVDFIIFILQLVIL
ncbi:hypothetical protein GLOIN_2v1548042 [Rhizophagus irregularis DAOM 181602=DAOM 197198]|uniref:Uncharacterized protein n=1 Tax=Rhizophagus irregularis (strain DAOM 181602 / DAOM 197198 / MUCL 43194) TaxID=747089 RepID=A0A2P4QI55_RHIID|nr:hypothetical protein GLOIN_2v1548042 [Rhizophagus irregularis DAOM 181602=DAOM 197198]POG77329.1 hypothetical protein GLOIN_2v1548042 [Rhizophagus irregularis DAOM 181602=DAOM 197198]GET64689.1 hypothetical protein GLOIN_2v1548042 [Rhizophagus irregularis DAOM 181602=DAOM 197198]|eukprot:XP_025184195.1 hypothetical protein GLOIN_2v1548042 [Rhizophagus irregularis DAOM 181602=DAOM 197198]